MRSRRPTWPLIPLAMALVLGSMPSSAARASTGHALTGFVVFYDGGASAADWMRTEAAWQSVTFDAATITPAAAIELQVPASALRFVRARHLKAYLCVSNYGATDFDSAELDQILQSPSLTRTLQQNLMRAVRGGPYAGLNIDFEQNPPRDAGLFAAFLSTMHGLLGRIGLKLSVDVPAKTPTDTWDGGYDYAAIGHAVDAVDIMAYDYSGPGGPPGPIAPVPWVAAALRYAVARIPAREIMLGIPAYAYDWYGKQTDSLTLPQVDALVAGRHIRTYWDPGAAVPWFSYRGSNGMKHMVYYEDARSLQAVLRLAGRYGVEGVSMWYIGSEDAAFRKTLLGYGAGQQP